MNETLKNIKDRFSCRDFTNQPPSDEQIHEIVQAAIQSPSGMNRQLWHIIVIKNTALISEIEEEGMKILEETNKPLYQHVMAKNGTLFYHAPCMILFAIKTAEPAGAELVDLGILSQTTVLAAASLGLASLHCGMIGFAFAGKKANDFKKRLAFPDKYECGMAVLLGHAKEQTTPHKPDNTKITYIH